MPIILLILAAWLVVLSIINYFQGYGEVAAVWFVGAWLIVGVSGILSRLDALCSRFGADTRSLNVRKRKPPQEAAGEQAPPDQPQSAEPEAPTASTQTDGESGS
ncbi:MAG: hypothetical protein BWX88_02403 [Planctomycetes bacterium ADurb.Bin126]|nr:MAG: hypothetical protein BWX88_02403 [Planctomycetes bacterium ADurb.Bin126]HOD81486.1 hypothetical protein [Phycisphaerae bacterium]HQL75478.1 hypothetical protein [Phycisphaerae bacterium]